MSNWGFSVVSEEEAREVPYPYVKVTAEGGAHELSASDRAYLEEKFHSGDGARPGSK